MFALTWLRLVLAVLATWRVTHLLANEDGPADLIFRFRVVLGQSLAARLMDCFNCLSLWIAAPAALFVSRRPIEWLFAWLALSGAACLLERMVQEPAVIQSARQSPEPQSPEGETYNVLRPETFAAPEQPRADEAAASSAISFR
jgi:hypothetical protein